MARIGRIIIPGFPHHVTQRGNRRQQIFFETSDYVLYRDLLAERCRNASDEAHLVARRATSRSTLLGHSDLPTKAGPAGPSLLIKRTQVVSSAAPQTHTCST